MSTYVQDQRGALKWYSDTDAAIAGKLNAADVDATVAALVTTAGPTKTALSATFVSNAGTTAMTTIKPSGDVRPGVWEYIHDSATGYLFHLMTGVNNAAPLIGMGIDNGGTGLFINNKLTGVGIAIQQNDTITSGTAYGIYANQSSTVAPLIHIDQADGAAKSIRIVTSETVTESHEVIEIITPGSKGGYISAKSGRILWKSDIAATAGARLLARQNMLGDGNVAAVQNDGVRLSTWNGADGGYWQKRINQNGQSISIELADGTSGGPDTAPSSWFKAIEAKQVGGDATATQIGFYGATPVAKPSGVAVTAVGIHAALVALGLISA